jgi:hypothetical protein
MIKRYKLFSCQCGCGAIDYAESTKGDWVRYKDYEKLERKYIVNRLKNIVIKIGTFDKNESGYFIKFNDKLKDIIEYFNKKQNELTPDIEKLIEDFIKEYGDK